MKKIILCVIVLLISSVCSKIEYEIFSTLHGVVSDYETGNPVYGVSVVLTPGGITVITRDDGYFEFQELSPQQYTITVQKSGYMTNRKSVNAISGENIAANITITPMP